MENFIKTPEEKSMQDLFICIKVLCIIGLMLMIVILPLYPIRVQFIIVIILTFLLVMIRSERILLKE